MTLMVYVNAELVINILISDYVPGEATRANASGVEVYGSAVYKIRREAVDAALRVLQNRVRNAVDTSAQSTIGVKRRNSILVNTLYRIQEFFLHLIIKARLALYHHADHAGHPLVSTK